MSPKFCAECGAALNELGRCPMKCDEVAPQAGDPQLPAPKSRRSAGPLTYPKFEALRKKGAI